MVDILSSVLVVVFVFVSVNFFKAAPEPLWKFSSFSFQFRLGRVRLSCGLLNMSQRSCFYHPCQNSTMVLFIGPHCPSACAHHRQRWARLFQLFLTFSVVFYHMRNMEY